MINQAIYYRKWYLVDESMWRWQYFTPLEIRSNGNHSVKIIPHALDKLEWVREKLGRPIIINSAYRDPLYNARVGGAPLSRHKVGDAFDLSIKNQDKEKLYYLCKKAGFTGFGLYKTFLHVDCGPARQWGKW